MFNWFKMKKRSYIGRCYFDGNILLYYHVQDVQVLSLFIDVIAVDNSLVAVKQGYPLLQVKVGDYIVYEPLGGMWVLSEDEFKSKYTVVR